MNEYQDIVVEPAASGVQVIRLNRPQSKNALRNATLREVVAALAAATDDASVRAVVITGGDEIFAAGADLHEMAALDAIAAARDVRPQYWRAIAGFSKPLIAAVNGFALGAGCEMLMHADIVVAGESARIGQPEINLGIIPGAGGTQRLVRTVGKPLAMKMVLGGEMISAERALAAGLVSDVVPDGEVMATAMAQAQRIAQKSPLAVALAKEAVLRSFEMHLEAGLQFERKSFSLLAASEDRKEGIAAFMEKRQANFTGK
ncbi:2,3-dehydroadipyl-CoA hydratase [Pseudoduganella ginsengisoli]|uniref:2,3-dehydroadipyl-CoA hydratase n=1 Tax=Pseudoduganella ginsengisoli TaxID=1462440 RepID=A0A6L6Q5L1_9BURK|nr:enoyl-CoA hydratase-related protein [Pseudoduganella ginsengisoli]MTW04825.1 2,3-dehydroadipyl-CoA hydratase [Pseudoduganella ginsengisoli]